MPAERNVLGKALRRPLLRWWLLAGLPLILLAAGITALSAWLNSLDYMQRVGLGPAWELAMHLYWLVPGICGLCWLLASDQLVSLRDRLAGDDPVFSGGVLAPASFRLALLQGLPPLAVMLVFSFFYSSLIPGHLLSWAGIARDALAWSSGVALFQSFALVMLLLIALRCGPGLPWWLSWLWFIALLGIDSLEGFLSFGLELHLQSFAPTLGMLVSGRHLLWDFLPPLGLLLCYYLLSIAMRRRPMSLWPVTLLGLFFLLCSLGTGSGIGPIDSFLAHAAELRRGCGLLLAAYNLRYLDFSLPLLAGLKLPRFFIEQAWLGTALALSANSAWLYLHFRLISSLITGASRSAAEALPEMQVEAGAAN